MLEETELVKKLREIVWEADLCTTTAGIIRKKLEDHFGVDLSSKKQKRLINLQINSFLEEQLKTEALNEEVRGEAGAQKEQKVKVEGYRKMDVLKEEERGIGNGTRSCFENMKDHSKGKETERQSKEEEEEEEDATSKSKKAVEQPNRAREDEAPTKLKEREKQPNSRGEEASSQSKETVVQHISAGEEEIPSKSKKSKRERQEDMEKSEKPRKKPKRTKVEAPSKSKKPSKQPIQAEEGVAPKSDEAEMQHKEGEEALLKTMEKESQPQTGTEAKSPPNDKDQKRAGSAFLDPLPISDALVKFLGTGETALSRTEAVKKIWIHIKQKKLQDCSDKQKVICDDKLKELFQVESFSGFKVQKLLEPHFPQDGIV